ncbi:hypothetical protein AWJ20_3065 [Sugiyamaella lignohabitans]|uniref:Uncharacterized protein n=1 Tax=Sugiyamaella lignohabitans TaxID=796027 RepID=A0A161HN22_9ASCO|nr:uncharacterized protein AWJ20_3065 [Sugiyamaella lignohabitans]ANB15437.1 hypothetical protein AWJ20_3065 [Sugiyamaella lignohabitans]
MLVPRELATIDNNTTNSRTMTTNPLSSRMDNNISTMVKRLNEITTSTEGVVNDKRNSVLMSNSGKSLEIRDVVLGVTNTFNVNGTSLLINGLLEISWIITVNKLDIDTNSLE